MPINDPSKTCAMQKTLRLYSGTANRPLAEKVADLLGVELSGLALEKFANGEIYARFDETVRGADVFFIQSISGDVNDALMELLIATDARSAPRPALSPRASPTTATRARTARPRRASPSLRASLPTCSSAQALTVSSRSTCTRGRSRASSTSP